MISGFYPPLPKVYKVYGTGPYKVARTKDPLTDTIHCDKPGDMNILHMKDAMKLAEIKNSQVKL